MASDILREAAFVARMSATSTAGSDEWPCAVSRTRARGLARPDRRVRAVRQWDSVRQFALSLPNAFEDFPWSQPVVKVATGSKWPPLFLWLGKRDADTHAVYVKLTTAYEHAIEVAGAFPTPMSGVGQYGRLTIPLPVGDIDLLFDWVDESYRNVAPKRLVALLDVVPTDRAGESGQPVR